MNLTNIQDINTTILTQYIPKDNWSILRMVCKSWRSGINFDSPISLEYLIKNDYINLIKRINYKSIDAIEFLSLCVNYNKKELFRWFYKKLQVIPRDKLLDTAVIYMGDAEIFINHYGVNNQTNIEELWKLVKNSVFAFGNFEILDWFLDEGYKLCEKDKDDACVYSDLGMVKYVKRKVGGELNRVNGIKRLNVLRHYIELKLPFYPSFSTQNSESIEYFTELRKLADRIPSGLSMSVINDNNLELAKWLHKDGKLGNDLIRVCCIYGSLEILNWVIEEKLETYNPQHFHTALENKKEDIVEYFVVREFQIDKEKAFYFGLECGNLNIIKRTYDPTYKPKPKIAASVAHAVDIEFLSWMDEKYPKYKYDSICTMIWFNPQLVGWAKKHGLTKKEFERTSKSAGLSYHYKRTWLLNRL